MQSNRSVRISVILLTTTLILVGCKSDSGDKASSKDFSKARTAGVQLTTPDESYPTLFQAVQMGDVFPDSKTFVDCTAKTPASELESIYKAEKDVEGFDLKEFVSKHFEVPPMISSDFKSKKTRTASQHVEALWPVLKRSSDDLVDGSTLIGLPNPYIVPGGRFREVYYWDSYFTMLGLVQSEEYDLIEDMLDNFAYLIKSVGHIPNGNRTYYKTRSQPPFFAQMVELYAGVKGDQVYEKYADALIVEYDFWMAGDQETKTADQHLVYTDYGLMNRYFDQGTTPRQESYREDFELAQKTGGGEKMYSDLRAGAESGWDYSSRWFADAKTMETIETTDIIPIDLNALLYGLERILLDHVAMDDDRKSKIRTQMETRKKFIAEKCMSDDWSIQDYNWKKKKQTGIRSLAMMYPLYFNMVEPNEAYKVVAMIKDYFMRPGGVVTSLHETDQQWDAPNGWAPLQWITVQGLKNYDNDKLARELSRRWVALNEKVYANTGKFVEKYNVDDMSLEAGGGEYPVQDGFGWSNGVYLALKDYLEN